MEQNYLLDIQKVSSTLWVTFTEVLQSDKRRKNEKGEFPTIEEGVRGMDFIEKAVKSNENGNIWLELE